MAKKTKVNWKTIAQDDSSLPRIHDLYEKPLIAGLWILYVSKRNFDTPYLSYAEMETTLQDQLDLAIAEPALKKALARAGNKIIRRKDDGAIKISDPGEKFLLSFAEESPLQVFYVEPKTPRTAKKNLEGLISSIQPSDLLINDPYYGLAALDVVETFLKYHKSAKFLTVKLGGGDSAHAVAQRIKDMKVEHKGKFEIRTANAADLHDRYVVASDSFLIIGQGIKDLGNKESFVLAIDDRVGKDIRASLTANFQNRWGLATAI